MITALYTSDDGEIVGLHMPNSFVAPQTLEIEDKEDGMVTFTVVMAKSRKGNKSSAKIA